MKAENCIDIFEKAINNYHIADDVYQSFNNPFESGTIENTMYLKSWIDTVQWHYEDIIRDPNIQPDDGMVMKRKIDKSNQHRTDVVEQLDDYYISIFKDVATNSDAKLNTESPGWVVDRISILCLKIYHMQEQVDRTETDKNHKQQCLNKLNILLEQKEDISQSFNDLLDEVKKGVKQIKVYRQMKMYNDDTLNPVLYKK
tara:strand:+ start:38 stop:637 length:600 start_codon:yes stop_codon:yes gene_type:complete